MNFDIIIGNPPYNNGMYLDFVQAGYDMLTDDGVMVMITPAKWAGQYNKRDNDFRNKMNIHISDVIWYPNTKEIFNIGMENGISIFKIDKECHEDKHIRCIKNSIAYCDRVGNYDFGFDDPSEKMKVLDKVMPLRHQNIIKHDGVILQSHYNCFGSGGNDTLAFALSKQMIGSGYFAKIGNDRIEINPAYIYNRDRVGKYYLTNAWYINQHLATSILNKNEVARYSTVYLYGSDSLDEVKSAQSYFESKLVEFLIYQFYFGSNLREESFKFVPDPGPFDHIFTDKELYEKYGLTDDEIAIIESVIKERK